MTFRPFLAASSLVAPLLILPALLLGQDVELLGEVHGTRPPDGYFEQLRQDPSSFRFSVEGSERLRRVRAPSGRDFGPANLLRAPARMIGPRTEPVLGTFRFPLALGQFADSGFDAPFSRERVRDEFFDGPNSRHQTITELYDEMSGGRVNLEGEVFEWVRVDLTRDQVTLGESALVSHPTEGIGAYVEAVARALDEAGMDWNRFDHTGDGFVDVLNVMHPDAGAECSDGRRDRIHSHRWNLRGATQNRLDPGFRTSTLRSDGEGYVYVNDYIVLPVRACNEVDINEIGVFAHELGHAFGLPDLYATQGIGHAGAGNWDLMGTGSWGCGGAGTDPARPCHMGAWTKSVLGWLDEVEEVGPEEERTVTLEPVLSSGRVLRIPARDGSREYLLLENRQRIGSDGDLYEPGLLVWHVDEDIVDQHWPSNRVNNDPNRMGVWLRSADGTNFLANPGGHRGHRGDPFPGCIVSDPPLFDPNVPCETRNRDFHIGTNPAAITHRGRGMGVILSAIELVGSAPYDVEFHLDTRFTWDTVHVARSAEAAEDQEFVFEVEGGGPGPAEWRFVDGILPDGFVFESGAGRLKGRTYETGEFEFTLGVGDGAGRDVLTRVLLDVRAPWISPDQLVAGFLGMEDLLTPELRIFLDRQGNRNDTFDLGDARAYLQEHGEAAAAPPSGAPVRIRVPVPPGFGGRGGR